MYERFNCSIVQRIVRIRANVSRVRIILYAYAMSMTHTIYLCKLYIIGKIKYSYKMKTSGAVVKTPVSCNSFFFILFKIYNFIRYVDVEHFEERIVQRLIFSIATDGNPRYNVSTYVHVWPQS